MKNSNYGIAFLVFIITIANMSVYAQNNEKVEFSYDLSGNRFLRKIVVLNKSPESVNDSNEIFYQDSSNAMVNDSSTFEQLMPNDNNSAAFTDFVGGLQIIVFPNPTSGKINLKISPFPEGLAAEISFFDFENKLLFRTVCNSGFTSLDLSHYSAGVYLMYIIIGDNVSNWKIIKE